MKLSDIMSSMALTSYAEVGLALFLAAFCAICLRLVLATPQEEVAHAAALPLADDGAPHSPTAAASARQTPNGAS